MTNGEKRARDWSAEERFAALVETHAMSEEKLGARCRRHALHIHELAQWRRDALAGTAPAAGNITAAPARTVCVRPARCDGAPSTPALPRAGYRTSVCDGDSRNARRYSAAKRPMW